jgi:hypothetical protein
MAIMLGAAIVVLVGFRHTPEKPRTVSESDGTA